MNPMPHRPYYIKPLHRTLRQRIIGCWFEIERRHFPKVWRRRMQRIIHRK